VSGSAGAASASAGLETTTNETQTRAGPPRPAPHAPETVDSYAEAWLDSRERRNIASAAHDKQLYEHVWKPSIGARLSWT
jgi:hypothetical protein